MRTESKRLMAGMAAAGSVLLALTGFRGRAQSRDGFALPHYVWLEREAVVAQPPQVVAANAVDFAVWSPDGRRVLAFRTEAENARFDPQNQDKPTVETSIILWNLATKRGLTVWKHRGLPPGDGRSTGSSLSWLPGTQIALLPIEWEERSLQPDAQGVQKAVQVSRHALLLVDTLRNQVREVSLSSWLPYEISPTKPQIALHDVKEQTVRILDSSGVFGPSLVLPKEPTLSVDWMPDGSALLLRWVEKIAVEKAVGEKANSEQAGATRRIQRFARMDAATGVITHLDKMPAPIQGKGIALSASASYAGPLHVRQTSQLLSDGAARHRTHPLWLDCDIKSDQARTLLCADGANAQISPRGDAVLYLAQDAAWVTPLNRLPREAFVQALRTLVMRNAKQAGLAAIMYCQDYDEVLPSSGNVISPYLKDDNILDGLNYTYGGGALKDIDKPAETILGTYPGPGGVAIIYADGHVKWKDK